MDKNQSDVTRQLCASAVLMGQPFRQTIFDRLEDKYQAVAPEVGLDANLLLQVCCAMEDIGEKRRKISLRYTPWFIGVLVVAVLIANQMETFGLAALLMVLAFWLIEYRKQGDSQVLSDERLLRHFRRNNFDPESVKQYFTAIVEEELKAGLPEEGQNMVVYHGFSPFAGAGREMGGWSFAINLTNPKQNELGGVLEPIPFEIGELYAAIESAHNALDFEGAVLQDMFFVNGRDIRDDRQLLPKVAGRPVQRIGDAQVAVYMSTSDDRVRHFKWFRVHYASDKLVVTFFLRCSIRGSNLFCEVHRFVLTPLLDVYTEIDDTKLDEERPGWRKLAARRLGELIAGIGDGVGAWFLLLELVLSPLSRFLRQRQERKEAKRKAEEVEKNPLHDYGSLGSIRELCSSGFYSHFFQRSDREMYVKVIDRTILDSIVEFVDQHNIDTSELKERRTTILNSGVIVQGGDIEADVLAVGSGAQATQTGQTAPTGQEKG